ncbi:MAG TPA: insulinase family protein [Gemmatimonadaceae bacterium]|nr:insulinase family protein [Gemmatimonadaceae bacterium]
MRRHLTFLIAALASSAPLAAQRSSSPSKTTATAATAPALSTPLPTDPRVRIGTLPNGLRYYIRQNKKPEKRAELRLVVNAGSILENENQLGLAHFAEHTAFNGTTHFAKNDLIKYLQSIGVRFGADLNASTGFDETVYILPIPTDTARIVEQAFTILEDWAHGQTFDSTEVANERGVVREEWRLGKGAGDRMLHQWLPIVLKGSKYADRLPIGNEASIMSATPARLRSFYNAWYRPDLEAVIAVGDFDPAVIEAQIKKHFGGIPKPVNAPKRISPSVPGNTEPLIAIASDKEATGSDVDLIFKMPVEKTKTVGDYRRDLMERLYMSMFNNRLDELAQKPNAPFLDAGVSKGNFIGRSTDAFTLAASVKDGAIPQGLEALLTEAKQVDEFGFLQSELDRAKENLVRGYERAYAERDKTQSAAFVQELVSNYLEQEPIPGIEYEYKLVQELVPTISLADVNKLASKWISDSNRVILAESPVKDSVKIPTRADLLAVFDRASKTKVTAYTETLSNEALVAKPPVPGTIVSRRQLPAVGITEWTLSNGARVLVKPTDFKADEVLMGAYSVGGTSLAPDSTYMSAELASNIVALSGLGNFSRVDLQKKLAGKVATAGAAISETSEGLSGRASPKDLETMFQLMYLDFTAPRLDLAAYQAFKNQVTPFLENRGSDPDQVFADTVSWTMASHSYRDRPITKATFAEVDPQKALAFYKDRFADASDFTFVFVGNVDTTALEPLVERYVASLPSIGRKESFRDVGGGPPKGVVEKVVRKGVEPKANTVFHFTGTCDYNPKSRLELRALMELFQIKLNETLREQLGGTYSPSAGGGCTRVPQPRYDIQIQFNSSPENVDKLTKSVLALIDSLKSAPPSQADVNKVKEAFVRSREVDLKQNAYWLGNIMAWQQAGEDLSLLLAPYDQMIRDITPATIQNAARKYFDTSNYARFVLLPENGKTTP